MYCFQRLLWIVIAGMGVSACHKSAPFNPNAAVITGISPASGPKNSTLEIFGHNFSPTLTDNQVLINGHPATVTGATADRLTVVVPAKAGTGAVEVKTDSGSVKGPVFAYEYGYYTVATLAGSSQGFKEGKGGEVQMAGPAGLASDKDGNIIVADYINNVIWKITNDGTATVIAGTGTAGYQDGPGKTAQFNGCTGVAVDGSNNIYVSDNLNHAIRELRYNTSGYTAITLAGSTANEHGWLDGDGTKARFYFPGCVTLDKKGHLYVTDGGNYAIRKITLEGVHVTTLAGIGMPGNDNGPGATASFNLIGGIAAGDAGDYLLAADYGNSNIRRLSPLTTAADTYVSTMIGGQDGLGSFRDGSYTDARFSRSDAVAIDEAHGHIFIADANNHCIRMADIKTQTVSTLVGDPGREGVVDGVLSKAGLEYPLGIAVDKDGTLYFTDNYSVRRIAYE